MIRASLMIVVALLASCITGKVQDRVLAPAIATSWEGVRADAELGGMNEARLSDWDMAVDANNFLGLDVEQLRAAAIAGVDQRLIAGDIGPNGAAIMRDRAEAFADAVLEIRRVVLVSRANSSERELVISRSSWANSPPPAIAGRTYR